ncbi:MAG: DUF1565 domain-containing protein [Planctomycetes bacterium]|nr:DUF1565 domain-containing protein [Planctomycetota bacterium]
MAFHVEGVQVEFSVNGAPVATAAAPTYNPRTEVWEFWFPLDPSAYPDGPLAITARAVCLNDTPGNPAFDLPSLNLYANSGGTLGSTVVKWVDPANGSDADAGTEEAPYATLVKAVKSTPAGGTINLQAGTYSSNALGGGSSRPYWTTIQAAPGVDRADVEIGPGRPGTQRLKWTNVTLFGDWSDGAYHTILTGEGGSHSVWLDDCYVYNKPGRWASGAIAFGNKYVSYITGGVTTQMANGPGGSIIRGHTLDTITSDAWTGGSRLVVNSQCIGIDPGSTGAHPDFHQSYTTAPNFVEDVILYNVRGYACKSQGLFGSRLRNSAFVNVLFERTTDTVMYSQYSGPMDNVMFLHINIINQSWLWRDDYVGTNVKVYNSIFGSMGTYNDPDITGVDVDSSHFSSTPMGTNITTGSPGYLDPAARNYRLDPSSPAFRSGRPLQCVPADIDGVAFDAAAPNRGAYAAANGADAPGDIDGDGDVDLDDFVILKRNFGAAGVTRAEGDLDGDGDVDLDDFVILKNNFGAGA